MQTEGAITVRHAGLLVSQRMAHILGAFAFAFIIPRLFGPFCFGQYALLTSLSVWFALLGSFGLTQVVTRQVPLLAENGEPGRIEELFGHLLSVRLTAAVLSASLYFILTLLFVKDVSGAVLLLAAASIVVSAVSELVFAFFLGLNRAAWWGMGELLKRWALVLLLVPGFTWGGLAGAFLGLLFTELAVLTVGLWLLRPYLTRLRILPHWRYLAPYLRFGLLFSLNDVLLTLFMRSGEVIIWIFTNDYREVGRFALAYAIFLTVSPLVSQVILSFAPLWTRLLAQHDTGTLSRWIERALAWLTGGCMLMVFGALLLGDSLVPKILGTAFQSVTACLPPLTLVLLVLPLTSVSGTLALVCDRPRVALETTAFLLIVFWGLAPVQVTWWGGAGACWAMLQALCLYAFLFAWRLRAELRYSLRRWALALATGGVVLLPIGLGPAFIDPAVLFIICCGVYAGLLLFLHVIRLDEFSAAWSAVRGRGKAHAGRRPAAHGPKSMSRTVPAIWRALRPLQWTKNFFVLMPLVFSHKLLNGADIVKTLSVAALFCLVSSSSYLFNDIQDMERDRVHPSKRLRPLVNGDLEVCEAVAALILLLFLGLAGGSLINPKVGGILAFYWVLNVGYSLKLKHYVILDVVVVAAGFILRVAAGAASISVIMSHWLTLCTALLALFLVLGKRRYDLTILRSHGGMDSRQRGSYDIRVLNPLIVAFGSASFISYVFYTIRQESQPHLLVWTGIFVLFGICRYIYLLFWKGQGGDPACILLTDFQISANLLLWIAAVVWIIYG